MPEGPTIKVTADKLRRALDDRIVEQFECRYKKAITEGWTEKILGQRVIEVRSHGKNLFITFENGWVMYTHMLMWGSWHVYAPDEPWSKEERKARVVLRNNDAVAVLFSAPMCELVRREDLATHKTSELGPDLMAEHVDVEEAARRFYDPIHADRAVGELIMDQTVLAGIGNILKSEVLFQVGINPLRLPDSVTPGEFRALVEANQRYMQRAYETDGFAEAFMPPEEREATGLWAYVYRRTKKPCLRCGTPIKMVRQGPRKRMTYFCPHCQPEQVALSH
jgi:endonuclease VIII